MRSLVRHLVDDEQYAVLTYRIALLHPDVRNLTAYLRANLHGLIPPYGSRITAAERAAAQRYRIRMEVEEGVLRFTTQNHIMKKRHEKEPAVGIENCRARLELLYPGRFTLTAREENSEYELNLTIRLK